MIEHHRPLGLQVLIELHTVPRTRKQLRQRCLAPFERLASQIVAIEFDGVECPHEHARIVAPVSDPVEQRDAIIPAGDRLAIDECTSVSAVAPAPRQSGGSVGSDRYQAGCKASHDFHSSVR